MDERIYKMMLERSDDIYDDIYYCMELVDSTWKDRIKPASEEKIKKLIDILEIEERGYKLPESYIEFLRRMGEGDANLLVNYDNKETNIDEVIKHIESKMYCIKSDYFEEEIDETYDEFVKHEMYENIALSIDEMMEASIEIGFISKDEYVLRGVVGVNGDIITDDFEKELFSGAIWSYILKEWDYDLGVRDGKNIYVERKIYHRLLLEEIVKMNKGRLEKYKEYLIENGYQIAWFSSEYEVIGIKKDTIIMFRSSACVFGRVFGADEKEVKRVQQELMKEIDLLKSVYEE